MHTVGYYPPKSFEIMKTQFETVISVADGLTWERVDSQNYEVFCKDRNLLSYLSGKLDTLFFLAKEGVIE